MPKLNQIIAIEKGLKTRSYAELSNLHKLNQKSDLFYGLTKNYRKREEEGEDLPSESKKVQMSFVNSLKGMESALSELFDITATKDFGNCQAFADVVVDGTTVVSKAPVTYLLFLEKQLNDIRKFVDTLPVLDESEDWLLDENSGLFKTKSIETQRTKKVQKPLVLYDATDKHPAQTQIITEDVVAGYWVTVKQSGAMPAPQKQALLAKVEKLSDAVKSAREEANSTALANVQVSKDIFAYLLGK